MRYYFQGPRVKSSSLPSRRSMDWADRWLSDGVQSCGRGDFFMSIEADMSRCEELRRELREAGKKIGYPAFFARAAAMALSRYPHLHVMRTGFRMYHPEHVDIALSVAGRTFVSPLLIVRQAETKSLEQISDEIDANSRVVREADDRMHAILRRWGWLVPFSVWRRAVLRLLFRQIWFRRGGAGTFQLTYLPDVDFGVPYAFSASGLLGVAGVRPRVIATASGPAVRPTAILSFSGDHAVWDGMCANLFLKTVRELLESGSVAA
jgi:pyruvate/2-oxoglutarate dehydrogenase complex dihydrolipoamide acyltransferase (E2) component